MDIFVGGVHCCGSEVISDLSGKITAVSVKNYRADLRMVENVAAETY